MILTCRGEDILKIQQLKQYEQIFKILLNIQNIINCIDCDESIIFGQMEFEWKLQLKLHIYYHSKMETMLKSFSENCEVMNIFA